MAYIYVAVNRFKPANPNISDFRLTNRDWTINPNLRQGANHIIVGHAHLA